jgi:hypothetical protein
MFRGKAIGLNNASMAVAPLPDKHKALNRIEGKAGSRITNVISEGGLYRLVLRSDKPEAEPFVDWVSAYGWGIYGMIENAQKPQQGHSQIARACPY